MAGPSAATTLAGGGVAAGPGHVGADRGGAAEQRGEGGPFEGKMARLTTQLNVQFGESARLEKVIRENLARLGYGE